MVIAAPTPVDAQDVIWSAPPLDTNAFAPSDLFANREGRDPFDHLFAADDDLAADANALEWLPIGPETVTGPMLAALRQGVTVQVQKPDEPTHTGFKALVVETGRDFNAYPQRHSTWVILIIGGAAAAIAHPFDDQVNDKLAGSDAAKKVFCRGQVHRSGIHAARSGGRALRHRTLHASTRRGRAEDEQGLPSGLRSVTRTHRVAGIDTRHQSHGSKGPPYRRMLFVSVRPFVSELCHGISSRAASWVSSRMADVRNRDLRRDVETARQCHFLSDVIFGGAVGVSSGWTVVGRHGRSTFALTPVPLRGGMMVAVTRKVPQPSPSAERP